MEPRPKPLESVKVNPQLLTIAPRSLDIIKDLDEGTDKVRLEQLNTRLKAFCNSYFSDTLSVSGLAGQESTGNILLQAADLFTASIGRVLNRAVEGSRNQKDDFADEFLRMLGASPDCRIDEAKQDFLAIWRL